MTLDFYYSKFYQSITRALMIGSFSLIFTTQAYAQAPVNHANEEAESLKSLLSVSCPNFEEMVSFYQQKFVTKMVSWSETNLSQAQYQTAFYPFSGPDVVTVMSLYPKANYYVMVADQVPEYAYVNHPDKASKTSSAFECSMLNNFSRRGYYLTNDLIGKNGPKPRFIKLLIYNLAFAGVKVNAIKNLSIDANGLILPTQGEQESNGVRFLVETKDGRSVTVDYISANISDSGLAEHANFVKAFERKSTQVVLIKSASHLLQNTYFSTMKNILVDHAQWITQDETGLDIVPYSENFDLQLFGKFIRPNTLWAKSPSAQRLANYYQLHPSKQELPFLLGYEKAGGSMLMIGHRKQPSSAQK
jgi:hypothetical protein